MCIGSTDMCYEMCADVLLYVSMYIVTDVLLYVSISIPAAIAVSLLSVCAGGGRTITRKQLEAELREQVARSSEP
jgi:hypothetical protein